MGSDRFTPSRGVSCQYLIDEGFMREAEMNPTADGRLRRVVVVGPDAEMNSKKADDSH
jgi:hypothetical protein